MGLVSGNSSHAWGTGGVDRRPPTSLWRAGLALALAAILALAAATLAPASEQSQPEGGSEQSQPERTAEDSEPEGTAEDSEPEDSEPKDSKPKDSKAKDSKAKDSEPEDSEPKDSEPKDSEPKDSEPKDSEPKGESEDSEPEAASEDSLPEGFFGISAPEIYGWSIDGDSGRREAALGEIAAAGISSVRTEIGWREVEPEAPVRIDGLRPVRSYRWNVANGHVAALARHGLALMPMLMVPPEWARSGASKAADCRRRASGIDREHVSDYAAYAGEVARRYGRNGSFWAVRSDLPYRPITTYEIWNEPNWAPFWCPAPDPETYGEMLAAAADAIRLADPQARIAVGGLVGIDADEVRKGRLHGIAAPRFLERMTARAPALGLRVNAVAVHPYRPDAARTVAVLGWLRPHLERVGLGAAELVVSEFGWHTSGTPRAVSEDERAKLYRETVDRFVRADCGLAAIYPHSWTSRETDRQDPEHWWGIADPQTAKPYPSGEAYAQAVKRFQEGAAGLYAKDAIPGCDGQPVGDAPGGDHPTRVPDDFLGASNELRFGKLIRNQRRGTARQRIRVPGPGRLILRSNKRVKQFKRRTRRAGRVAVRVRPRGNAKRRLSGARRNGQRVRARVPLRVVFRPRDGQRSAHTKRVRLVRNR